MTLLAIASRTYSRRTLSTVFAASSSKSSLGARFYSGSSDQVDHFVSGWDTDKVDEYKDTNKYCTQTFNKISEIGLSVFTKDLYDVIPNESAAGRPAHALMLRSHKLKEEEVIPSVRAIARCGAGTNNIPVARMTELGIPVFNTPGANANAVKEIVLCGLLLGSRSIVDGINHMKELGKQGLQRERVEKDKAMFGGREIKGKTLAVIGLGHIGASTAADAYVLGMNLVGYDPGLSVQSAMKLPGNLKLSDSITSAVANADYISLNIPYTKATHGIIGQAILRHCKPDAVILNFARGELVDSEAMKNFLDQSEGAKYISDFPDDLLWDHSNAIVVPHLGASTGEAEDSAAAMAAETLRLYLEDGTVRHSVNFPDASLPERNPDHIRITVVNQNKPGVLSAITEVFAKHNLNIMQQINHSKDDVAYTAIDIEADDSADFKELQQELTMSDGVLSSRVLFGLPGAGYSRNIDGQYHA
mmetsp:Transcript_7844/g.16823  ORF Transcript_7844/g.16823 Transcript_7844/m.16823 type:complete len:474 (+) Transcript_7844:229-1650(+)|eukprot:CAMPEP_0168187674 /NCGR_PEP_ID=MMETSP0139_2-20121125/15175_1 /TAXON_ID=44445 /ORGANISM="Pseudo-nitzschia australis, Strain 10249 10 AB" /LENGTH=473 /DNA_ID=CAMNT_0008109931 /DNA_START=179 /DNA_END=1600 /DNA_ORIENTATION=-